MLSLDQAHEQNNAKVNYSGGAVGSTENPVGLKIWMVSSPEQARLLIEFERHYSTNGSADHRIHEQGLSTQRWLKAQVNKLCATIALMGNPFVEESHERMAIYKHQFEDGSSLLLRHKLLHLTR